MTQHVTIHLVDGKFVVSPPIASVWRDDQTLMWHVGEGVCWPTEVLNPVEFLKEAQGGYAAWPGTTPTALGDEPGSAGVDRRLYVALARKFMPDGKREKYQYTLMVARIEQPDKPIHVHVVDASGRLIDPEVENEPLP